MTSCGPGRHTVSRAKYDSDDIYYAGTSENTKKKPGKKEKNNPKNQHGADLSPVVAEDIRNPEPTARDWYGKSIAT